MSADTTLRTSVCPPALTTVLSASGITTPTPIQAATPPDSLSADVLGRGRTGSGKTYAFLLPMLARLSASRHLAGPGAPGARPGTDPRARRPDRGGPDAPGCPTGLTSRTVFGGVDRARR